MYIFKYEGEIMKVIFFLIFIFYYSFSYSHECILKDTTPKEITIYNACLSKFKTNRSTSELNKSLMSEKILKLKNENLFLKNKLLDLQNKLRNLSKLMENYANL